MHSIFFFRRFLLGTGILLEPEGVITAMIEVTIMVIEVIEKETGILIQRREQLAATIVEAKLRGQAQGWTDWQQVRVELTDHGRPHIDLTRIIHISLRMGHCALTPPKVVLPMWHMVCIQYRP